MNSKYSSNPRSCDMWNVILAMWITWKLANSPFYSLTFLRTSLQARSIVVAGIRPADFVFQSESYFLVVIPLMFIIPVNVTLIILIQRWVTESFVGRSSPGAQQHNNQKFEGHDFFTSYRSKNAMTSLPSGQRSHRLKAENKCTRMVLVMITAYTLLKLPSCFNFGQYSVSHSTAYFTYLHGAARLMSFTNSAINFLIYFASGKQFRTRFWQTFSCLSRAGKRRMGIGGIQHKHLQQQQQKQQQQQQQQKQQ